MKAQISKWGNSLGVRIPAPIAVELGLKEGVKVDLKVVGGELVLKSSRRKSLRELLDGITPENLPEYVDWGHPMGKETW